MPDDKPATKEPVLEERLARDLERHKGRWVAVDRGKIVAVADSAEQVLHDALQKSVTDPLVFRVPVHPERIAFF